MKRAFRFLTVAFIAMAFVVGIATSKDNNVVVPSNEITVKTSVFSWMCMNKIETNVLDLEGVMDCEVDLKTKIIKIKFDPKNITPAEILNEIEDLGYDAKLEAIKKK